MRKWLSIVYGIQTLIVKVVVIKLLEKAPSIVLGIRYGIRNYCFLNCK